LTCSALSPATASSALRSPNFVLGDVYLARVVDKRATSRIIKYANPNKLCHFITGVLPLCVALPSLYWPVFWISRRLCRLLIAPSLSRFLILFPLGFACFRAVCRALSLLAQTPPAARNLQSAANRPPAARAAALQTCPWRRFL
jgi:hypothetical protein